MEEGGGRGMGTSKCGDGGEDKIGVIEERSLGKMRNESGRAGAGAGTWKRIWISGALPVRRNRKALAQLQTCVRIHSLGVLLGEGLTKWPPPPK